MAIGDRTYIQNEMLKYKNSPYYNKMPKYITNPNLILLTQKLQEEAEYLDRNVPPETLKQAHQCIYGNTNR